jgi:ABC-type sugar transport system ATPase subunit
VPEHALLQVRTLKKSFSAATVFAEVCFDVAIGEAVAIVGPNGAGKSTLLNWIVGTDAADSGDILLHGSVLDESAEGVRSTVGLPWGGQPGR